ncbi:non-homologous end-joining DNA ligase [Ruania albidiflava]|uniref:non-homologous end-joining DNA ligase n=1 Tax=Ruania albidiflava TaxID=366586 RepID=UPI0023F4DF83|nr:non-homologous end-joining DNA ligase [Ruania albidiflava]
MSSEETIVGVRISRPEKEMYPATGQAKAVTKADVARYYADLTERMLPHLRGRPISMQRFPDGIEGSSFYEKKVPGHFPDFVATTEVDTADGSQRQVTITDQRTLVYLADQACLTPHVWLSAAEHLDAPDQLIIDLDPSVPGLTAVRRATTAVGELLDELGLTSFVKTTGSRGYHVLVPLRPERNFDDVRRFARSLAQVLIARAPDLLTLEARKNKRGERVLVDIQRNAYGQTAVPPFALRARPGAPVATPIGWDEVSRVAPDGHTIRSIKRRLAQIDDPWDGIGRRRQSLTKADERLRRLER